VNWFLWFLAGWFLWGAVVSVWMVGKPRKPLAADSAAVIVVVDALLIAGIFIFGVK
jgi:hypothetical protein